MIEANKLLKVLIKYTLTTIEQPSKIIGTTMM
jgi:hypothetical protein